MIKYIKYVFMLGAVITSLSSCEDFVDVNTDPNSPTSVPPDVLLATAQARLNYTVWGDYSRYSSVFSQHVDGVARQFQVYQNYGNTSTDFDALWTNMYAGTLADLGELNTTAIDNDFNHYLGMSKVLEAYSMLLLTDFFDDVPYAEFKTETISPAYDSQSDVLSSIMTLLSDAKGLLTGADGSGFVPDDDDLIYGGDVSKWVLFANAIEARVQLRLDNYPAALTAIQNSYDAASDQASFEYGTTATTAASWYQYIDQRDDIDGGANYIAILQGLNDPREAIFGIQDMTTSHPYFTIDRDCPYISYVEAKFIEAEATFEVSGAAAAKPIYLDAIKASFDDLGLSDTAYMTYIGSAAVNPGTLTKTAIMTQKYIALYTDPEAYSDWRRTGIPSLTPNTGSQIPTRFLYPQLELDLNVNAPSGVSQFDNVGWDN